MWCTSIHWSHCFLDAWVVPSLDSRSPFKWLLYSFDMTVVAIDNFVALRPVKMFQIHSMYFLSHIWNCCFYNMHWFLFWRNVIKRSQSRFLTPELLLFLLMYVHKQKYLIENLSNLLIFFLLLNLSFLVCLVWEYFLTMDF